MRPAAHLPDQRLLEIVSRTRGESGRSTPLTDGLLADPALTDKSLLRGLVDSVQAGVLVEDSSCRILLANQAFCRLLEINESPSALVGWEARMVFDAIRERFVDPAGVLERTEELIEGRVQNLSEKIRLTNGSTVERDFLPIFFDEEYNGHFWIFRDISSHIEAKNRLRQSGERLKILSEITSELGEGGDGDFNRALGSVAALLGLGMGLILRVEGEEFVVEHAFPFEGPVKSGHRGRIDQIPSVLALDDATPAVGMESISREFGERQSLVVGGAVPDSCIAALVPSSDGYRRVVSMAGMAARPAPWTEEDLDLVRLFALWIGKTLERCRDKEELRESEERYRDFIENTSALVCIHDLDGVILEVNGAVLESLGMTSLDEIVGRNLSELIDPSHQEQFIRYLYKIASEEHHSGNLVVLAKDGTRRVFAFDNSLRREGVDRPVVRGLGQDITARHEFQRKLHQRVELENLLLSVSTSFINLPASSVAVNIEHALGVLGQFVGADAGLVFLLEQERRVLVQRYSWYSDLDVPVQAPEEIDTDELPMLVQSITRQAPFRVDRAEDLPTASTEREHLARWGLRSLLALPISRRGELLGFVGLVSLSREIEWQDDVVSIFRIVGDILGSALERRASAEALEEANARLQASNEELAWTNGRMAMLNELGDLLQSSTDSEEARAVIRDLAPRVCPGTSGAVFLFGDSRMQLEKAVSWGERSPDGEEESPSTLAPGDCWALRRGRPYRIGDDSPGPLCRHSVRCSGLDTLCLPLMAQGEAIGILTLRGLAAGGPGGWSKGAEQLSLNAAEHMALGLANLRLRESLREQAVRDPLTGLYNRRYLEEQFARELGRTRRRSSSLGVLMIDIDHFKRINDTHGHEGGDRILVEIASLLSKRVRGEDVVARFGGEEFTILLADTGLVDAVQVAEGLRSAIHDLQVSSLGRRIEGLSVSIGVAAYPECSSTQDELLRLADGALYQAKETGRDRVVAAYREAKRAEAASQAGSRADTGAGEPARLPGRARTTTDA